MEGFPIPQLLVYTQYTLQLSEFKRILIEDINIAFISITCICIAEEGLRIETFYVDVEMNTIFICPITKHSTLIVIM